MLRKSWFMSFILALAVLSANGQTSQSFSPDTSSYRRGIYRSTGAVQTYGLQSLSQVMQVGRYGQTKYRGLYQWSIPDGAVPDYAVIDTVQISFSFSLQLPQGAGYQLTAVFRNIEEDLVSANLDTLWNRSESASRWIGNSTGDSWQVNAVFTSGSSAVEAVEDALSQDRFVLGIQASTETVSEYLWWVSSSSMDLRVVWHRPSVNVSVGQRLQDGTTTVDSIARWNVSSFQAYQAPASLVCYVGQDEVLRATQKLVSGQKYQNWNGDANVRNHRPFQIPVDGYPSGLIANLAAPYDASARAYLTESSSFAGSVDIEDPWFIDLNESPYGWRNRGDAAVFNQVSNSPSNLGTSTDYKGVFLNQEYDPQNPSLPHYRVRAAETQTVNGQPWVFWKWDTSGVTLTSPSNLVSGYYESPAIFRNWGSRTVTAQYKAHLASNASDVMTARGQRRLVAGPVSSNVDHLLVYGSAGSIWASYKAGSGAWGNEVCISGSGSNHATPSVSWGGTYLPVVWRSGSSGNYSVLFNKRSSGSWLATPVSVASSLSSDPAPQIAFRTLSGSMTRRPHVAYRTSNTGLTMRWSTDDGSSWGNSSSLTDNDGIGAYSLSDVNTLDVYDAILTLGYVSDMRVYVRDFQGSWGSRVLVPASEGENRVGDGYEPTMTDNLSLQVIRHESTDRTEVAFNQYQEYYNEQSQDWLTKYYQVVHTRDDQGTWGTATAYETSTSGTPSLSMVNGKFTMLWEDGGTLYKAQESQGTWGEPSSTGSGAEPALAVSSGTSTSSAHYAWRENASGLYKIVPSSSQMSRTVGPQLPAKRTSEGWVYGRVITMIDTVTGGVFSVTASLPSVAGRALPLEAVNDTLPGINAMNFFSFMEPVPFTAESGDSLTYELTFATSKWPKEAGFVSVQAGIEAARLTQSLAERSIDLTSKSLPLRLKLPLEASSGNPVRFALAGSLPEWADRCVFTLTHVYSKPITSEPVVEATPTQTVEPSQEEALAVYPNPFNPATRIIYGVVAPSEARASEASRGGVEGRNQGAWVKVSVYDLLGREVAVLVDGWKPAGTHSAIWNARELPSGTYLCRLTTQEAGRSVVRTVKMQYLR